MLRFSRLASLLMVALVVTASCSATLSSTQAGDNAVTPAEGSSLEWSACHDNFECSQVEVPLDWFEESDETISLAVIRLPATGDDPIGSVFLNPGGPGESGVNFLAEFDQFGQLPDELTERFDLVSWDPRGTGESAPIACATSEEMLEAAPLVLPPAGAERDKVTEKETARIEACIADYGDLIPYVGTQQTAQDLDALRAAVGDELLTYVGFSYGTSIGLQYLQDNPDNVRAMVLDGVVVPGDKPVEASHRQIQSFETNLDLFLDDCAERSDCAFGDGKPRKALEEFLADLETGTRIPASYFLPNEQGESIERKGTLGISEAFQGIILPLYSRESWEYLEVALKQAAATDNPDGQFLLMFRDQMLGRQLDGSWNHSTEANTAINCADQVDRADSLYGDLDLVKKWSKEMPIFGKIGAIGQPGCFLWPEAQWPVKTPTAQSLSDAPEVLLVNSTHDAATPYANAETIDSLLRESALMTVEGEDHTSFAQGISCVDSKVLSYLVTTELPSGSLTCEGP